MTTAEVTELDTPWLVVAEVCTIARRHPDTVRDALNSGELHGHQFRKRGPWRVHIDSARAWVESADPEVAAITTARACSCRRVQMLRPGG